MTKRLLTTSLAAAICLLGAAPVAHAGTVTYSFDTMAVGTSLANPAGNTLDNGIIQTYMRTLLTANCATCSMTVGGNASVDQGYTGDGHVVGGASGATSVTPKTLGTTDGAALGASTNGANDNFIKNLSPNTSFSFAFTGLTIQSVSFDYEIFPDGSCTNITSGAGPAINCGTSNANLPDMTFSTNLGQIFHYYAVTPTGTYVESPCTDTDVNTIGINCTASTGTAGTYAGHELTPQLIGTTALLNLNGATTLTFTDWPATIGIDNLKVNFTANPVPEPASMLLLGTGLAMAARRRMKNRKA